jgi:hypothetical protein
MSVTAPEVIERYFRAVNDDDADTLVACFTSDAAVSDEDRTHAGHDEIRAWREETKSAYQYTAEVISAEPGAGDQYVVVTRLTGNFPGSPLEMTYLFTLHDELISKLDIE